MSQELKLILFRFFSIVCPVIVAMTLADGNYILRGMRNNIQNERGKNDIDNKRHDNCFETKE